MHYFTRFPESSTDDIYATLRDESTSNIADRYNVTKLMGVLLMRELASRLRSNTGENLIIVNAVDPSICRTDLTREFTGFNAYAA
jgi:retinol dehydrogenase-12